MVNTWRPFPHSAPSLCDSDFARYEAAAKELRKTGLQLAKCDATVATKLAGRVSVEEYPTALFLRAGSFEEMPAEGDTTSSDIVAWVREHAEGEAEVVDGAQLEEQLVRGCVCVGRLHLAFCVRKLTDCGGRAMCGVQSKFKKSRTIVVGFFDSDKSSDAIAFTRATVGFTDMKVCVDGAAHTLTYGDADALCCCWLLLLSCCRSLSALMLRLPASTAPLVQAWSCSATLAQRARSCSPAALASQAPSPTLCWRTVAR